MDEMCSKRRRIGENERSSRKRWRFGMFEKGGEVRMAVVRTVKDDDFVVVEELHVHGRDAYTRLQEIPPPAGENR